jgi:hypothetical protein
MALARPKIGVAGFVLPSVDINQEFLNESGTPLSPLAEEQVPETQQDAVATQEESSVQEAAELFNETPVAPKPAKNKGGRPRLLTLFRPASAASGRGAGGEGLFFAPRHRLCDTSLIAIRSVSKYESPQGLRS